MTAPRAGDIRLLTIAGERRAVLVLDHDEDIASVALITDEPEMISDQDIVLRAREAGLSFDIVVEPDVIGPVSLSSLGPMMGRLDQWLGPIAALTQGEQPATDVVRGPPLIGRRDPRWARKERLATLFGSRLVSDEVAARSIRQ